MGFGFGTGEGAGDGEGEGSGDRRRGGRRGGRRTRRVGFGRRRRRVGVRRRRRLFRYRRRRGGTIDLFACCLGGRPKDPCQANQKDLLALETQQNELLMMISQQQQQQMATLGITGQQPPPPPPDGSNPPPPTYQAAMNPELAEDAKEIQEEQNELLKDILKQQETETDPEKLQELFRQQNNLLQQMHQLQNAGFQYQNGIPPPLAPNYDGVNPDAANPGAPNPGTSEPVPMAAFY